MAQRYLFILTSVLLLGGCQPARRPVPAGNATGCIDSARIDSTASCTMEYAPVCGCNGKTYSNPCVARKAGLLTFTAGPCPTRP